MASIRPCRRASLAGWVSSPPLPSLRLAHGSQDKKHDGIAAAIDWIIVGGESGPHYRPMDHAWARAIRDECVAAGVAFFFKQSAAPRTEMGTALEEGDGSRWEWRQFPGELTPAKRVR